MSRAEPKNIAASVRTRLLNWAKDNQIDFNRAMLLYVQECFLYRLSKSSHAKQFILKGGVLFFAAHQMRARPTRDIDFLVQLLSNENENFLSALKEILKTDAKDGVVFLDDAVMVETITENAKYSGLRIKVQARLCEAIQILQIDAAFGDVVSPAPIQFEYPSLFKRRLFHLSAYSWETVIAEKFESIVRLSDINSRMKDFFDIWFLSQNHRFNGNKLSESIRKTFENRGTDIRSAELIFNATFWIDVDRRRMWTVFLRKMPKMEPIVFSELMQILEKFLHPVCESIQNRKTFDFNWEPIKQTWKTM